MCSDDDARYAGRERGEQGLFGDLFAIEQLITFRVESDLKMSVGEKP